MTIIEQLKYLLQGGLELIFPPLCFHCNRRLDDEESIFCEKCWQSIPELPTEILNRKDLGGFLDKVQTRWIFDEIFQEIVHHLKYANCRSLGRRIGQEMGKKALDFISQPDDTIIIPVPLHPVKKRERGYNQASEIAYGLSDQTGITVKNKLIKRVKNTASQTKMNKTERIKNMKDAFKLVKPPERNNIIIVDDVYTTGTTMNSVAKILKEANPSVTVIGYSAAMPES